jgi:hypothetical protein
MLPPAALYPLVSAWLQALGCCPQQTGRVAVTHLVTALLTAQSLQRTALMRALWSPRPVPARQRYKRLERLLDSPWLSPAWLTPGLVRAALALVAPVPPGWPTAGLRHLALDSVRCGRWEIFTLGVVWHGRVLPVGWAVLPYSWPKGRFTPTVCRLLRQVAAAWPAEQPAHLVADRAFPSYDLFATLRAVGWGYTLRLQARHWLTLAGQTAQARTWLATAQAGVWTGSVGAYGSGPRAVAGTVVVGRGPLIVPAHQATPGSLRHRARRLGQRAQHAASKNKGRTAEHDQWVILFSTHPTVQAARASYRRRWPIEGSYRDAQTGWDGQHGWGLRPVVTALETPEAVARLVGLWALGTLLQSWVGHQAGQATAPPLVQQVRAQWTTTGRLSVWARGQLALTEPSGQLTAWLQATLTAGAARVAASAPPKRTVSVWPLPFLRPKHQAA